MSAQLQTVLPVCIKGHQVVCYKASIQLQQVAEKRPCVVLQSMRNQQNVNLTAMVQQIPPHVHIYWYTAENGVSLCCQSVAILPVLSGHGCLPRARQVEGGRLGKREQNGEGQGLH